MLKTYRDEPLTVKEIVDTLNNIKSNDVRAFVVMLYKTGARRGEVKLIKRKDIEYNEEYWTVKLTTLKQKKNLYGNSRTVKIVRDGLFDRILLPHIQTINNPEELLFKHSVVYYWQMLKKSNPNIYPHFFRHNLACTLSEYCDVIALQQWFGWRRLDMALLYTRKRYAIETIYQKQKELQKKMLESKTAMSNTDNTNNTINT